MKRTLMFICLLAFAACSPPRSFSQQIDIASDDGGPKFEPGIAIVEGSKGTLQVTNTTAKEHGFSVEGLNVQEVVPPGQTISVKLKSLKPIDYSYFCQLHDIATEKGGHRRGVLRVSY